MKLGIVLIPFVFSAHTLRERALSKSFFDKVADHDVQRLSEHVNKTIIHHQEDTRKMKKMQHHYDKEMESFGEVPLHVLENRHAVPLTFDGNVIYDSLRGMNIKLISSVGYSPYGKIYEVISRPFIQRNQGGWREMIAFHVDRALALYRIPNMALQPKKDHVVVSAWALNITDHMVTQSFIRNVSLVFLEKWTECFPDPTSFGLFDNNTSPIVFRGKAYEVVNVKVRQGILRACPRDFSLSDKDSARLCLPKPSSVQMCNQHIASVISELFLFDLLIGNGERLHKNGASANVHILNYHANQSTWRMVYIDQGHHTFERDNNEENFRLLAHHCLFPRHLTRVVGRITTAPLSEMVKRSMGDALVARYDQAVAMGEIGEDRSLDRLLQVVDKRVERISNVFRECHQRHGRIYLI